MTPELRELLELSAKAMGYEVLDRRANDGEWIWVWDDSEKTDKAWLPHLDKAQCFYMECALGITVDWSRQDDRVVAFVVKLREKPVRTIGRFSDHNNDRAKARMMASLRVAAEIGRRMQDAGVSDSTDDLDRRSKTLLWQWQQKIGHGNYETVDDINEAIDKEIEALNEIRPKLIEALRLRNECKHEEWGAVSQNSRMRFAGFATDYSRYCKACKKCETFVDFHDERSDAERPDWVTAEVKSGRRG